MVRLAAVSDVVVSGSNAANVVGTAELCRNRTISHARPSPTPTHHFTAQDRTAPPESTVTSMAHSCRAALITGSAIAAAAACPSQDGCPPQTMSLAFAPTDELVMSRKCHVGPAACVGSGRGVLACLAVLRTHAPTSKEELRRRGGWGERCGGGDEHSCDHEASRLASRVLCCQWCYGCRCCC